MESQSMDSTGDFDSDVIEIIPMDEYDSSRAQLRIALSWILHKAYPDSVSSDLRDPFYETNNGQWHLKPRLVNMLSSSELYCQACSNMFPETAYQWHGHSSIIQVLSRKGIYVIADDDAVTETVLMKTAPFRVNAHLALIEALMRAFACETVTVERVVQAVKKYGSFTASSDLPSDLESSLVLWVNKVSAAKMAKSAHNAQQLLQGETNQKVRIVSRSPGQDVPQAPSLKDLMSDIGDGKCLALLISFYCPQLLNFADICMKEAIGIADSLYNLRIVRMFCESHLPAKVFHFSYEDLLYTQESLRPALHAFLADLFRLFEVHPSSLVDPALQPASNADMAASPRATTGRRSIPMPPVPISQATKRSFQKGGADDSHHTSNPELNKISPSPPTSSSLPRQQPLLHKRHGSRHSSTNAPGSRRTASLSSPQERETIRQSVLAWAESQEPTPSRSGVGVSQGSGLLDNVSMDLEVSASFSGHQSLDLGELEDTPRAPASRQGVASNLRDPNHPDYLELESVASGGQAFTDRSLATSPRPEKPDKLLPARTRPAKEKVSTQSKAEELGEVAPRRKGASSPTKTRKLKPPPDSQAEHSQGQRTPSPREVILAQGDVGGTAASLAALGASEDFKVSSESSEEMVSVTPLPDDQLSMSVNESRAGPLGDNQGQGHGPHMAAQRKGCAFYISQDPGTDIALTPGSRLSAAREGWTSSMEPPVTTSYTISDQVHTPETARAAGIPVLGDSGEGGRARWGGASREGSVASSRSSGDFSDHESHKIHLDHKARESMDSKDPTQTRLSPRPDPPFPLHSLPEGGQDRTPMVITDGQTAGKLLLGGGGKGPLTTNFAEIKRLKEKYGQVDNSGFVYMQHGVDRSGNRGNPSQPPSQPPPSLKSAFLQRQGEGAKKTATFSALPSETTWQQTAQARNPSQGLGSPGQNGEAAPGQPVSGELLQLRMKLEEKRRDIERKKKRLEMQQNKIRQRLGKAAFLRVVSKNMNAPDSTQMEDDVSGQDERSAPEQPEEDERVRRLSSSSGGGDVQRPSSLVEAGGGLPGVEGGSQASNRPFSREGIQQTIDNVRKRWFQPNTLTGQLVGEAPDSQDEGEEVAVMTRSQGEVPRTAEMVQPAGKSPAQERRVPVEPTDPRLVAGSDGASLENQEVRSESGSDSGSQHSCRGDNEKYEEYNSSLDRLNRSLTELQGEIARLSLQQEQIKAAAQSPQGAPPSVMPPHPAMGPGGDAQPFVLHPFPPGGQMAFRPGLVPHQPPQPRPPMQSVPYQAPQYASHTLPRAPPPGQSRGVVESGNGYHSLPRCMAGRHPQPGMPATYSTASQPQLPQPQQPMPPQPCAPPPQTDAPPQLQQPGVGAGAPPAMQYSGHEAMEFPLGDFQTAPDGQLAEGEMADNDSVGSGGNEGFFVSFGDEHTPKRPKPKLRERQKREPKSPAQPPLVHNNQAAMEHSPQPPHPQMQASPLVQDVSDVDSPITPSGVPADQNASGFDSSLDDEMLKKKDKLLAMQAKRREEQERKRQQKEKEENRKREQQRQKAEESERRKMEEKQRREQIFQNYLQRKEQEKSEESTPPAPLREHRPSKSRPRPKSMFAKSPKSSPAHDLSDSGPPSHSSQEDLYAMASPAANSPFSNSLLAPSSARRQKMRKAVSCNTLDQNGAQGGTTYRRPPSPDLYRLGQRRGPGSETGSNSGSEYTGKPTHTTPGPKLFVKPSSKSNRHIIINAISHCCLAGIVNVDMKNKVLEVVAKTDAKHFLILFRDHGCQYRALYTFNPDTDDIIKVHGVGPKTLSNTMIERFFKYNSGSKSFTEVKATKHMSISIDAVVLQNSMWKGSKTAARK